MQIEFFWERNTRVSHAVRLCWQDSWRKHLKQTNNKPISNSYIECLSSVYCFVEHNELNAF